MSWFKPKPRFSECWQFLTEYPGTLAQQDEVRRAFRLEWGTPKHRLFKALDKSINGIYLRSFMTFGFLPDDMWPQNMIAVAGVTGINMREGMAVSAVHDLALHELGHVVDKHLMTAAKRRWFMMALGIDPTINTWNHHIQETFADAVRDMILGQGWTDLWSIILEPL